MTGSTPSGDTNTQDEELLADLFDALLQEILDGRTPDLAALHPDRPELRDRITKTWALACSVAGRREPSRPVLGGYEIVRELGHGGMGTVYLARHLTLQRDVAIKVLPHSLAMSPRAKQRFVEEARALAQLRHENVVHIHRIVDHAEMLAFEMEFIDGPSLQSLLQSLRQQSRPQAVASLAAALGVEPQSLGTRSTVEWFVRIAIRIARALAHVHRHGLVHRDVKPSNVLLRACGTPVLADFGLALAGDLDQTRTRFAGTPVYAAPERLRLGQDQADARTDVYSLGVTLYEALTLQPPYPGSTTHEVLRRIDSGRTPSLRELAPHVSRDLATVVQKAMEADPRHRYASADEFADDLERLLSLQPIQARPAGPLRRSWQFVRRHQRQFAAAIGGALVVALVAWPYAVHAAAASTTRALATAAWHEARSHLLVPECLPSSWSAQPSDGKAMRHGSDLEARAAACTRALQHYDRAGELLPDEPARQRERAVVATVAELLGAEPAPRIAAGALPPLCRALVEDAREHRPLGADDGALLTAAADDDRYAAGLFAFLWGDHAANELCWDSLGSAQDPLIDACIALRLAEAGQPEHAYPRLFHAARAFPKSTALALALGDAALASGDVRLAEQWIAQLPAPTTAAASTRGALLAADLLVVSGQHLEAQHRYRELARQDPSDPRPLQRLVDLMLRRGDQAGAQRMLHSMLQRWPDLGRVRRQLARLSLQQRDTSGYLAHARHALALLRRQHRAEAAELGGLLRLGGLQELLAAVAPAEARFCARSDDSIPLSGWLPMPAVLGAQHLLRTIADFDAAAAAAGRADPRPLGTAMRATWHTILAAPPALQLLPWSWRSAALLTIPALLGRPTTVLGDQLLPFQRSLGDRMRQIGDRRLFSTVRDRDDDNWYGHQIVRLGDLDGDTLEDLAIAAPPSNRNTGNGFLQFRSRQDGSVLGEWRGEASAGLYGRGVVAIGDVDGDLCTDVAVSSPLGSRHATDRALVELRSGRTGARLWHVEHARESFGVALSPLDDLDGDGTAELLLGAPPMQLGERGLAMILSGRTGTLLRELPSDRSGVWYGAAVAAAGDLTGDGIGDLAIGGNFGGAPGLVAVLDARSGAVLTTYSDANTDSLFGAAVLGVGDVDGDGRAELAIAAPGSSLAGTAAGSVVVLSSRTGRALYELRGERAHEHFGVLLCLLPDWRRDGRPALAVSATGGGPGGTGYVRVFDLGSGRPLQTFAGSQGSMRFGYGLVDLGRDARTGMPTLGTLSRSFGGEVSLWVVTYADAFGAAAPVPSPPSERTPRRPQLPAGVMPK